MFVCCVLVCCALCFVCCVSCVNGGGGIKPLFERDAALTLQRDPNDSDLVRWGLYGGLLDVVLRELLAAAPALNQMRPLALVQPPTLPPTLGSRAAFRLGG